MYVIRIKENVYGSEKLPIFGPFNCLHRCAEHFNVVFFKDLLIAQFDATIQSSLSSELQEYAIRMLICDDASNELACNGQEIDLVCHPLRGLHSRYVRIH